MKRFSLLVAAVVLLAVGCTTVPAAPAVEPTAQIDPATTPTSAPATAANPTPIRPLDPVDGVKRFQALASLSGSQPKFSENTMMANSPSGSYKVMLYKDSEGRAYSVDPVTFLVVEVDARSLLPSFNALSVAWPEAELASRAEKLALATSPEFEAMRGELTYEGGQKGDLYFYDWRGKMAEGQSMPRFLQVAFHRSGQLVAYYNTLGLE